MEVTDLLDPSGVIPNLRVTGKRQALQELARRAATLTGEDEHKIFESLREREQLGSTGIGNGTAVPHGRIPGFKRALTMFARLEKPIDFDAIDSQPVDLIFLLLTPADAGADHLKALARISRLLRNRAMCVKLRGTESTDAIYALLTDRASSHAA
ncbi:MAG TPA: PTS IIA-like nitrogen regulatory protein PtsN [Stellaceae bacterium]|jgi:PTS system nitrogen regulatory IIA component|nr:PTS IIA-like nitrogen regulatory protein PtsN [Stellaceae bacterium]